MRRNIDDAGWVRYRTRYLSCDLNSQGTTKASSSLRARRYIPAIRPERTSVNPVRRLRHAGQNPLSPVMQVFQPRADTIARVVLVGLPVLTILGLCLGYEVERSAYVTQQNLTREQPIPFSHAHHSGQLGIDCRYCHTSVEQARFAGIPSTETCMTCHSEIWTNAQMLARRQICYPGLHELAAH